MREHQTDMSFHCSHMIAEVYFLTAILIRIVISVIDMIAVPELFFGAMENWGLITYKERYMLYTPGISPQYSLEGTTVTITHELAHQV